MAVESSEAVSPMILLYRTPADAENMEIPVHGLEEILRYVRVMTIKCTLSSLALPVRRNVAPFYVIFISILVLLSLG